MPNTRQVATADLLRLRKERVHSTMLVEVLALLIFMAMTFAFVLRDDALKTNTWKIKHDEVAARLATAEREIAGLRRENVELAAVNRRLLRGYAGTIPANDALVIGKKDWEALVRKLAAAEAAVAHYERGRGGVDLPNCVGFDTNFIVRIDLVGGGYRVTPKWPASAAARAAQVDGLTTLANGRVYSAAEFRRLSAQVKQWGRNQSPKCNFRAEVFTQAGVISVAQQNIVGDTFYARVR